MATVLQAIEEQFRATGYAGTSLDDVAAATGLGRGSIYAAFGDKHELFMRSLSEFCERTEARVAAALDGPDDTALERLHTFLLASAQVGTGRPLRRSSAVCATASSQRSEMATSSPPSTPTSWRSSWLPRHADWM